MYSMRAPSAPRLPAQGQYIYLVTGEGLSLDGFREELAVFGA